MYCECRCFSPTAGAAVPTMRSCHHWVDYRNVVPTRAPIDFEHDAISAASRANAARPSSQVIWPKAESTLDVRTSGRLCVHFSYRCEPGLETPGDRTRRRPRSLILPSSERCRLNRRSQAD